MTPHALRHAPGGSAIRLDSAATTAAATSTTAATGLHALRVREERDSDLARNNSPLLREQSLSLPGHRHRGSKQARLLEVHRLRATTWARRAGVSMRIDPARPTAPSLPTSALRCSVATSNSAIALSMATHSCARNARHCAASYSSSPSNPSANGSSSSHGTTSAAASSAAWLSASLLPGMASAASSPRTAT